MKKLFSVLMILLCLSCSHIPIEGIKVSNINSEESFTPKDYVFDRFKFQLISPTRLVYKANGLIIAEIFPTLDDRWGYIANFYIDFGSYKIIYGRTDTLRDAIKTVVQILKDRYCV